MRRVVRFSSRPSSASLHPAVLPALLVLATLAAWLGFAVPAAATAQIDAGLLAGLEARAVGPATMSGRIAAIQVAPTDPDVIYVGAATGGVWKSTDAGITWRPIFDDQPVAAIGAVAVSPANADVVWVGTGEGNPRNSTSVGNGVYRTRDGGETWSHLGLEETERIHRILLHPQRPEVAWVAALGKTWGENPERGVFKTTDGGETWQKVLYVDEGTGAADLVMDPRDPDKLIAALWDHRRWPWFFRSGGPGSGLHVTRDGGATWRRLTADDGLPEGDLGRMGLAIAPSDPQRVYALVESEGGIHLYRSDDGARSFRKTPADRLVGNRPFYYADLRVDPANPDRIYSLWSLVSVSEDGGDSFRTLVPFRSVHPDHHAMWIDPEDPSHLWNGNDGGIYESRDHGESWRYVANLPLAQYYHIRVDDETPYNIYGGMQDNGSWKGPSAVWENGGIRNFHWREVAFGDGFDTVPLPGDPSRGFGMSQEGYLVRWDLTTGERKDVRPPPPVRQGQDGEEEVVELRFNWNAPIALDPFVPDTVYYGSQFVHRSRDLGESWEVISPDLTTDNPEWQRQAESGGLTLDVTGAENFTSLVAIAPSPLEEGLIWVGSDDGRLHLTRDGGETWSSLEDNVPGVPEHTWIPHIAPSPHDAGTAFVVFDDHRRSNWTPYVFKTTDYGATWTSLATDDLWGYALVVAQDPVDPELLFLGTEFGLWVSLDGGASWHRWTHGVPTVSVMDLAIQPRMSDLVLGTHGRSAFVLDDYSALRDLTPEILAAPIHLFPIPPAQQYEVAQSGSSRFPGSGEFRGENRPYGALITVSLHADELPHPDEDVERQRQAARQQAEAAEAAPEAERRGKAKPKPRTREEGAERAAREVAREEAGESRGEGATEEAGETEAAPPDPGGPGGAEGPRAVIEITDAAGTVIRTFEEEVNLGVNRVAWDLRYDSVKEPPAGDVPSFFEPRGPEVLPGTYTVTVRFGEGDDEVEASGPVEVLADPRMDIPTAERQAKLDALLRAGALQEAVATAIERLHATRDDVAIILEKAEEAAEAAEDNGDGRDEAAAAEEDGEEAGPHAELLQAGKELRKAMKELEKTLWTPPDTPGIPAETDAWSKVRYVQRSLGSSYSAPTPSQQAYLDQAAVRVERVLEEVNRFFTEDVAAFRALYRDSGLELLPEAEPVAVDESD